MNGDILFLCQFFYPENVSSATLPFDTAKHLVDCGYKVGALCGYPKEYSSLSNVQMQEEVSGIQIQRIKYLQLGRKNKLGRLINYFSFTLSIFLNIRKVKKYRSIIVYSNPPILPAVAVLAKKLFHTKIIFVAYDIYPEIGYASESIKRGSIIDKVMKRINRLLYVNVDKVISLTDEMKNFLLTNREGVNEEKIVTIANWAHEKTITKSNNAYELFDYKEGQFIVSYFGNMGICQDLDTLLSAANMMKDNDKVRFLVIGHGNKKDQVNAFVQERQLNNVQVLDYITGTDFEQAVAITSCFIVSLEKGLKGTCAPSKYYSYLQGGHPVIVVVEADSYLAKEVAEENIGYFVPIGDGERLKLCIEELEKNPELGKDMGKRARLLYLNQYDKSVAMAKYQDILFGIIYE